jgi:hypothetical protein
MCLSREVLRNDVAGISFADASPQKRHARPSGADIGGVRIFLRLSTSGVS